MSWWQWLVLVAAVTVIAYVGLIAWLLIAGRRQDARALAGFIPDCVVLFRRLLGDERVPRRSKLLLVALIAYLAMPLDVIPDFIPVVGQLDDAIVVGLTLRSVLRAGGPDLVCEHWPGPPVSLHAVLRLGYGRRADTPRPRDSRGAPSHAAGGYATGRHAPRSAGARRRSRARPPRGRPTPRSR